MKSMYLEIQINVFEVLQRWKKDRHLVLNKNDVFTVISNLSYIFPIGKIQDPKNTTIFLQTMEQNSFWVWKYKGKNFWQNSFIKDIATISKKYEDSSTLYSF